MRRQARELALQILFQTEFGISVPIQDFLNLFEKKLVPDVIQYAAELVEGIQSHQTEIDSLIKNSSRNWKMERMPVVDRNIARICIYEMLFSESPLSPNIAINEAVEIVRRYSTSDSASFLNGLLDQISKRGK